MRNGIIRDHEVTYYLTEDGPGAPMVVNTGSIEEGYTIMGLMPFTNYSVSVAAETVEVGTPSEIVVVRTAESSK